MFGYPCGRRAVRLPRRLQRQPHPGHLRPDSPATLEPFKAAWPAWPPTLTNPCLPPPRWVRLGWPNPLRSTARVTDTMTDASIGRGLPQQAVAALQIPCGANVPVTVTTGGPNWKALVARANRTPFFRRALKVVNGRLGQSSERPDDCRRESGLRPGQLQLGWRLCDRRGTFPPRSSPTQ